MRCSKRAFESGSAASADGQKNGNAMCASCVHNNVNFNRRQLMPKRKHGCRELAIRFCCSGIDKGTGPTTLGGMLHGIRVVLLITVAAIASYAAEPSERASVVRVPGASKVFKAQADKNGAIHLIFDSDDGPQYIQSRDSGATFGAPITVVDAASQKPGLKFNAWDLAVGPDGRVHVAMGNNAWKLKLPTNEWAFYYASLAPGAKEFTPTRNINHKPSEGFSIAAGPEGAVSASFLSGKLYAMSSRNNGESFSPFAEINPAWNPCDCCTTAATYGSDGKLAVLYREETGNDRDIYLALLDQRAASKPTRTRVSTTGWRVNACPMTYFTIAPTDTGYVTAWPTKGQVYFARLDKDGAVLAPGEIKTPGTSGMRSGVVALHAKDGATLVAWKNKETLGWQLYDTSGQPQGSPGSEKSAGNGAAGVALPNGKFVLFP